LFGAKRSQDPLAEEEELASKALDDGRPIGVAELFGRILGRMAAEGVDLGERPPHLVVGLVVQRLLERGYLLADQAEGAALGLLELPQQQREMAAMIAVRVLEREGGPRSTLLLMPRDPSLARHVLEQVTAGNGIPLTPITQPMASTTLRHGILDRRLIGLAGRDNPRTEGEIEEELFEAGYEMVPGEVATWFRAIGEGATVGALRLPGLREAIQLGVVGRELYGRAAEVFQPFVEGDPADPAPYLPIATVGSGGVTVWEVRMEGAWHERVVRRREGFESKVFAPNLVLALDALERPPS